MTNIHATAIIEKGAELDADVDVGAYAVVGAKVKIGKGTRIGPHAVISGSTTIGSGNLISSFASIGSQPQDLKYRGEDTALVIGDRNMFREYTNVSLGTISGSNETIIGSDNLFMVYVHVAHDCVIGNQCIVANSVALAGHVEIDDGAVLGGLSAVHQFVKIGSLAMIAGGAMVAQDVTPYTMVHGDRAAVNGLNVVGLRRLGMKSEEMSAVKQMYNIVYDSKLTLDDAKAKILADVPESLYRAAWLNFLNRSTRGLCR